MMVAALFADERARFHADLLGSILTVNAAGVPSNADKDSRNSVAIALHIATALKAGAGSRVAAQTSGNKFESICGEFVKRTFTKLGHLRPGEWSIYQVGNRDRMHLAKFAQYAHLKLLDDLATQNPQLSAALGSDYTITPDVVVVRAPEPDAAINRTGPLVDGTVTLHSDLRESNGGEPILHASISCKWTMRSDRAQNSRSEALNLMRNRKGRLPHIVAVTGEPLPTRIASIALGTGDIDCVYHFALYELRAAVAALGLADYVELLDTMVDGKRLRDISDLPLDLAV